MGPSSVFRQAEHALAEDVLENLRRAGTDAARAREQLVELPLALVGRPRPARDLRVRPDHLRGRQRQLLVEMAPEEFGRRALRSRRAAFQDLGEAAVAVELQRLLADPQLGDLLADDGVGVTPAALRQLDQALERVTQRDRADEGE